jgi:hypothetical protein
LVQINLCPVIFKSTLLAKNNGTAKNSRSYPPLTLGRASSEHPIINGNSDKAKGNMGMVSGFVFYLTSLPPSKGPTLIITSFRGSPKTINILTRQDSVIEN